MAAGLQVVGTATTADEVLDPASQERPASIMSSFLSKFVAIAAGDSGFSILPEEYSISNRVILTVVWPLPVYPNQRTSSDPHGWRQQRKMTVFTWPPRLS